MENYRESLKDGLLLANYDFFLKWDEIEHTVSQQMDFLEEARFHEDKGRGCFSLTIKSRLFDSTENFVILFNFFKNKVNSISLFMDKSVNTAKEHFCELQEFLVEKLGKPKKNTLLSKFFRDKEDVFAVWKIGKVKVVHQLFDVEQRTSLNIYF